MRRSSFLAATFLVLLAGSPGCAGDEDLTEGRGGEDTGPAATLDAPPPDTTAAPDTAVPDSFAPDTAPVDTGTVDTSVPETPFFCTSPTECPGADTDCLKRGCVDGKCRTDNVAPDTPTASQIVGDCKKTQCDGLGGVRTLEDFTDLPKSTNECASYVCEAAGPKDVFRPSGTPCTTGGGAFCDGAGKCVACVSPASCPGTDTECRKRSCVMNACGFANTPDGTPAEMQTAADCKVRLCDGMGGVRTAAADTDLPPSDGNPCTREGCSAGSPVTLAPAPSTPCGVSKTCDVARPGICGQCNVASHCTAPSCKVVSSCTNNTCVFTNAPDTTGCPLAGGVTGWCSMGVCLSPIG